MVFREATGGESKGWEKGERRGGKFVAGARPSTPRHGEKAAPILGDSLAIRRGRGLQRQTGDASPTDESENLPTRSQSYLGQISVRCRSDLSPISAGFAVGVSRRSLLVQSGDFALTPALATKTTVVGLWSPARRFSGGSGLLSDARDQRLARACRAAESGAMIAAGARGSGRRGSGGRLLVAPAGGEPPLAPSEPLDNLAFIARFGLSEAEQEPDFERLIREAA